MRCPIDMLHQHGVSPDPMGGEFDYAEVVQGSSITARIEGGFDGADDRQQVLGGQRITAITARS